MYSFVETRLFTQLVKSYLSDDEYRQVQLRIIQYPRCGAVVPGSGGVRKLRWRAAGRGNRAGYRVVYFLRRSEDEVWMLTIYPKNVRDTIPAHVLKAIRREIENAQ